VRIAQTATKELVDGLSGFGNIGVGQCLGRHESLR